MRDADRWLRRIALYGPLFSFVLGWGSGFISSAMLFKDHEKRITRLEAAILDMSLKQSETVRIVGEILTQMEHKVHG